MRPTGKLHLGNYMGALYNWVRLQHDYNCYFFVADWHALTTDYADTSNLRQNTHSTSHSIGWRPGWIRSVAYYLCSPWCPSTRNCTCCFP